MNVKLSPRHTNSRAYKHALAHMVWAFLRVYTLVSISHLVPIALRILVPQFGSSMMALAFCSDWLNCLCDGPC